MGKRVMRNDRGQTSIEYLGIIAVVVAIVLVVSSTDIGSEIANAISNKVAQVVGI
ncbi:MULTISPECIES: Flp family type IVb pilin [Streptomyces]|uniref:Flp family type IVb pilin n=3 Tax=Streptomyces violaceusniger group TaxID=2839105 RepID=A0A4D4K849_9ACTN|nr:MULTISPECIES: Flp family type IVb pilin [Streptomyces]MEE4585317.1 Flp family type IVb pilin [Streptomyces sp. DSM 41602]AJZ82559.1 Flp family type IVb pilin [Streptomyces sp. AgN23]EXU68110.1 membrane protein [Streptomyces sp. PRh5]RSS34350.1 Flp family type IVb pilin [Streptomyces sp. WAC05858]TMU92654.1 Flp family type IVb pilin [Streptomyces sp. DASNCL29]